MFSVSCRFPGCARDDLHRFRLPHDLPAEIWLRQRGVQLSDRGLRPAVGHADAGLLPRDAWGEDPRWSGEVRDQQRSRSSLSS